MAAVLAAGKDAVLSDLNAGALWGICKRTPARLHVTVAPGSGVRPPGLIVHRRRLKSRDRTRQHGIPVTSPARTLIDLATTLDDAALEAAVGTADRLRLIRVDTLRERLCGRRRTPGVARLESLLDARTFRITESALERRFLAIVRAERLPLPQTQVQLGDARVDFFWPDLGLVVEADGLAYHRTPASQQRDRRRDQAHVAAGRTVLRFSHAEVAREPEAVASVLKQVLQRLEAERRLNTLRR